MIDRLRIVWLWAFVLGALLLAVGIRQLIVRTRPALNVEAQALSSPTPLMTPTPLVLPAATLASPTPGSMPDEAISEEPDDKNSSNNIAAKLPPGINLIIPVLNVKPAQLRDTFSDARSSGRTHNAIDIMAPMGTPVIAAEAGEIVRLFTSELGGITLYQLTRDRKVVFYYAHLSRYADGLAVGQQVKQGDVLAYVGDTGNVTPGNTHLHFAVWLVDDPKRYWNGVNLNPYDLLKKGK